jgi:hypothetical protein
MLALAVAFGLSTAAYGVVTITETFDTDPISRGWSGVNSNASNGAVDPDGGGALIANDYGFKATDDTGTTVNPPGGTATGAGEIGGVMNRAPDSFYGVDLAQGSPIDFNTTDMRVTGVLRQMNSKGSSTLNVGWSKGITTVNTNSGNALYVSWDDGFNGAAPGMRARGDGGSGLGDSTAVPNLAAGTNTSGDAFAFTYDWNSTTNTFSFTLGSNPTGTLTLTEAEVDALGDLTHWGLWGRTASSPDDAGNQLRIDDVTFTGNPVPEPASLGLLALAGLVAARRRRV